MAKKERIVRHTDDELKAIQARGGSKSDWAAAAAMTSAEVEAAIAADPDEAAGDWAYAPLEFPRPKAVLNMRIDRDVLEFFRREGRGYQTKINAVLRSYVEHQDRRGAE